jgi:hypothetical protein
MIDRTAEVDVNKDIRLGEGLYMRHLPSGRVYPYEENGAKSDDVEVFKHTAKGDVKIPKGPSPKLKAPLTRKKPSGDTVVFTNDNLAASE